MILTKAIQLEAANWLGCKSGQKCLTEIRRLYNEKSITNDAWCALFVWTMTNEACKKLGVSNPLKQTKSTAVMLSEAKKTLRTDNTPSKGSVFYTTRTGGGHVGFVLNVEGNKFYTIEGNTTNSSGEYGVFEKTRDTKTKDYQFIHLEDLDTFENNIFAPLQFDLELIIADPRSYISAGILLAGGFIAYKIYKTQRRH